MPTNPIIDAISAIPLLRPVAGASDGEGGLAPVQAKRRAPGRALPRLTLALSLTLMRAARRLEEHWIGDLIGAACLFGTGYLLFFAAGVLA